MLKLTKSKRFKKDLKRISKNPDHKKAIAILANVINLLQNRIDLPERYQVHRLRGQYSDYLECHIRPDLLLIYSIVDDSILELVRLGSHSELFR